MLMNTNRLFVLLIESRYISIDTYFMEKFTESEMVVGGFLALGVDGACAFLEFITLGYSALFTPIVQGGAVFLIDRWVAGKGGPAWGLGKQLTQYSAGLLPVLPTTTGIFITRVIMHNNPKITATAGKVVGSISPAAGGVAGKKLKKAAQ